MEAVEAAGIRDEAAALFLEHPQIVRSPCSGCRFAFVHQTDLVLDLALLPTRGFQVPSRLKPLGLAT